MEKQKSRSEEKLVGFSSAWAVTQGRTRGIDHLMWRKTQEAGIVKAVKISKTMAALQKHSYKTRMRAP